MAVGIFYSRQFRSAFAVEVPWTLPGTRELIPVIVLAPTSGLRLKAAQ